MKTAELIVMPFGLWTQVGPRNHVLCIFRIPLENGHFFWGGAPLLCGLSSEFFVHLLLMIRWMYVDVASTEAAGNGSSLQVTASISCCYCLIVECIYELYCL